jgi:pimeloyl-ACP methyl ester carboxylesterase
VARGDDDQAALCRHTGAPMTSEAVAKSHTKRSRRRSHRWVVRILVGLSVLIVVLAGAGLIYQTVATKIDEGKFPPPGQLVTVGDYSMHISCVGQGSPAIILDAAGGNSSASWGLVQPEISRSTRVCAYDRAGMGWSERGPTPRDLEQHAGELRSLLSGAGIDAPYVLVGHSYGARVALVYAKTYPSEVAGMALIDPGKLDDDARFPPENGAELAAEERTIALARWLAPFGVVRLFLPKAEYDDLPAENQAAERAFNVTTKFFRTLSDQYDALPQTYVQQREVTDLGTMPLVVLSATVPDDASRRVWTEMNGELSKLSTRGVHRVVPGATHSQLLNKREHAQITIDAIRQVVQAADQSH